MSRSGPSTVQRLGDSMVNFYLVHHDDGLTLVDAGLPGQLSQLTRHLARTGHQPSDITAVLLTHTHPDHTGLAAVLREHGARILVHERDAATLRDGPRSAQRHSPPERPLLTYLLRRPQALRVPLHMARRGAFTACGVADVETFAGGTLDTPGRPRAIPVPGHTPGSTAFHFPHAQAIFVGDALVTHDALTGHTGPTLVCGAFTHSTPDALASLRTLSDAPTATLLPGHGDPVPPADRASAITTATERSR